MKVFYGRINIQLSKVIEENSQFIRRLFEFDIVILLTGKR
jgi:hypothetical protein